MRACWPVVVASACALRPTPPPICAEFADVAAIESCERDVAQTVGFPDGSFLGHDQLRVACEATFDACAPIRAARRTACARDPSACVAAP